MENNIQQSSAMNAFAWSLWQRMTVVGTACLAGAGIGFATFAADPITVTSPNGAVRFEVFLRDQADLHYRVTFKDKPVIETSALAMTIDNSNLTQGVELGQPERSQISEKYPWRGVHSQAVNEAKVARIPITHSASKVKYTLEVRAANDGAAFRFVVPGDGAMRVPDEASTFVIPSGSTAWYHGLGGHYEAVHEKKNIADVPVGEWAAPPVTFKLPGDTGYASITEAALMNYSGMALEADGLRGFKLALGHKHPVSYPFRLRYSNDVDRVSKAAAVSGTITSPWRVIMVGSDLNALVNCDLVHNLCPPADSKLFPNGMHTEWVKPGRTVWKYLDGGGSTLAATKEFCAWASKLGFEYNVVEGYWSRWSDDEIKGLVEEARKQGVGLWFWKHSKQLRTSEAREEFFKKLHDLGVVGAKIDFFDHEHKEVIDLYQALLANAAKYHIMVNFHGANKPVGESRMWPNELVREGIRGMESSRLLERARHNTTVPFTRFLAGHADYTPVHFGTRRADTTWAHQIATAVVFTAPLLTYAAHPTNLLSNPAVEMIKSIPPVWDETIVLPPSEIGELAAFARRHGTAWFVAILNGPTARTLKIPLTFLGAGNFRAMVVRDGEESASVKIENTVLKRTDSVEVTLSSGGGFIVRLSPD
jgi:alpha-glucosidase